MSQQQLSDFASTPRKGLPRKKSMHQFMKERHV